MDIKQYGKREKRLVEQIGMARMWDFNQLVIAITRLLISVVSKWQRQF